MSELSVLIPTKNEEDCIGRCLESVAPIASEIVVLDSFSEDSTVEICEEYGAKITQKEFEGFAQHRKCLLGAAQEDWLLFIDADEEVTDELAAEIERVIQRGDPAAYRINMKTNMFGSWVGQVGENPVRFGPKEAITVEESVVHEEIVPTEEYKENVQELGNDIHHYTYSTVSEYMNKTNQYTALEALSLEEEGRDPGFARMLLKGLAVGVYELTLRRGYKAGSVGVFFALFSFQYRAIVYFKQRELKKLKCEQPEQWREQWVKTECQRE